jgi:hypothetical protein
MRQATRQPGVRLGPDLAGGPGVSSARLAVPLVLLSACTQRPFDPSTSAGVRAAQDAGPALELVDELARFSAPDVPEAGVAIRDEDTLIVAHASGADPDTWVVEARDPRLAVLWSVTSRGRLQGLATFPDGRVLVMMADSGRRDLTATVLDRDGATVASATLASLTGTPCKKPNRYWLARSGAEIVANVLCDNQWARVWLDRDLVAVRRTPSTTQGPAFAADATLVEYPDSATQLARANQVVAEVLPRSAKGRLSFPTLAAIDDDDVVVAGTISLPRDPDARPRFLHPGQVSRHGKTPWTTPLVPAIATNEPTTIAGAGTTLDGAVLVALAYRGDGHAAGVALPRPSTASPEPFGALAPGIAIAELDGRSGQPRRVLALRPRTAWNVKSTAARVAATSAHLIVASGDEIVVFPRRGQPLRVIPGDVAVAPPAPAPIAPLAAGPLATITASWATVCGPRRKLAKPAPCRIESVAIGRDGTIAVAGGYYQANQLGATPLPRKAFETGVVAVFEPGGTLRWHKTFGVSWHNGADRVLVRDDGTIVVLGHHGLGFSIDGHRLPDRVVPKIPGSDTAYEANTPFLALFDRTGRVQLLEDVDALAHGDRSTDPKRQCAATLAQGGAEDELWLRADCADGVHRLHVRGTTPGRAQRFAIRPIGYPRLIDASGTLLDGHEDWFSLQLLRDDGRAPRHVPVFERSGHRLAATSASGTWLATTGSRRHGDHVESTLLVAHVDPDGAVRSSVLGQAPATGIDGLTVDDQGRAVVTFTFEQPITVAGHELRPSPVRSADRARGRAIVRLAATGAIDRLIVTGDTRHCANAANGNVTSMSARGDRVAMTTSFGVDPACGVTDEPSSVVVFDLGR